MTSLAFSLQVFQHEELTCLLFRFTQKPDCKWEQPRPFRISPFISVPYKLSENGTWISARALIRRQALDVLSTDLKRRVPLIFPGVSPALRCNRRQRELRPFQSRFTVSGPDHSQSSTFLFSTPAFVWKFPKGMHTAPCINSIYLLLRQSIFVEMTRLHGVSVDHHVDINVYMYM